MAVKVSRIEKEFIFNTLKDQKTSFELQIGAQGLNAKLKQFNEKEMLFVTEVELAGAPNTMSADLYIFFRGTRITTRVKLLSVAGNQIKAEFPEALYRDLSRGYERIHPEENIKVKILLDGNAFQLDFPASEEFYEPEAPSINVKFDAAKITNLLKAFREKALSFSSENKIVMFRERKPTTLPETILAWSGKALLLPLEDAQTILRQRNDKGIKILTKDDLSRIFRSSGQDPLALGQSLQKYLDTLNKKKIWHELYCPVLFREYVVGYIYLLRSELQTSAFSDNILEFVHQFSRLLAYSLHQNGYFQSVRVRQTFEKSQLLDISGSGLLFSMPVNGPSLALYTDLELELSIKDKKIPLKGRVMRRYQDNGMIYIGVKFLELSYGDSDFLLTYLYGEQQTIGFSEEPATP